MSVETSEPRGSLAPSLPIWRTAFGTYALIFRNLGFLIRAGSFWLLLAAVAMTALDWASHRLGLVTDGAGLTWKDLVSSMATSLVQIVCLAGLAVQWHRQVLHVGSSPPPALSLGMVAAYALTAFALEACFNLVVAVLFAWMQGSDPASTTAVAAFVALIAGLLVATYFWGRVALMLPAIALGRDSRLRTAWRATRGNGWRLLLSSLIAFLLPILVMMALAACKWALQDPQEEDRGTAGASNAQPAAWELGQALLTNCELIFFALFAISFLSIAYRELVLKRQAPEMPAVTAHS